MKRILLASLLLVAIPVMYGLAQERTITGTVTSQEDGTSLPGVNVVIKGTTTGTVSDIDGNYRLSIPPDGEVLVFSFIGLASQEITIGNQSVIDVVMAPDFTQLTEVVVTAVGIEREKKALGYSVENVGGDKIQQVSEPDPLRALQGKVAGVNITGTSGAPGSSTKIQIRGNSSFLNNNNPLIVVDGIPYNTDVNPSFSGLANGGPYASALSALDPNSVSSITVLKGAAASSLYGARASNGVIVITTKGGSAKASKKGLEVAFSSTYAVEQLANIPEYQNTYGTGTNFNYQKVNGSWGSPFPGARPYTTNDSIAHPYSGIDDNGDGIPDFPEFTGTNIPYRAAPTNVEDLFENGSIFENSLTVSGGNERSIITSTISHLDNQGYTPNTQFERLNLSAGGKTQLDNGLLIGANVAYSRIKQDGPQTGVGNSGSNNNSAFARSFFLGRNWDMTLPYQNPADLGSIFWVGRGQANNPYWAYENTGFTMDMDRVVASIELTYDITDWVSFTNRFGVNSYTQRRTSFERPGSTGPSDNPGVGRITNDDVAYEELNNDLLVTFRPEINEEITLSALVGWNVNERTSDRQAFQGTSYVVFDIDDIDNTNSVIPFGPQIGFERRRLWGLFTDITVGYRDWAFVTLTGRNDHSSTLPINKNSFFYGSISGSVVLTDALGIQSDYLNFLKLRASWSQVGNDTDAYQLQSVYEINSFDTPGTGNAAQFPFIGTPTATLEDVARDPNLKPEKTQEYEFGAEVRFIDNRFGFDVNYYKRRSTDQIAGISVADATGFRQVFTNFGELTNEGIEMTLDATVLELTNGFRWNVLGTFTHNKNVVVELVEGLDEITIEPGTTFAGRVFTALIPGQEYGLIKGPVAARDQDGNLLIDPSNGQLLRSLEDDIIGNPNPDFIVGLTNTFSYKGVVLSAVIDWRQGGDIFSNTVLSMLGRGVLEPQAENREVMKIIPGVYADPNTLEPIRDETGQKIPNTTIVEENTLWFGETFAINAADEFHIWDGTYIRLREVMLGYDFPTDLLSSTPFGSLRLSFTGRNLWYNAPNFPPGTNYDPEVSQFGSNSNVSGIEWATAPSVRRYAVNLRVTF